MSGEDLLFLVTSSTCWPRGPRHEVERHFKIMCVTCQGYVVQGTLGLNIYPPRHPGVLAAIFYKDADRHDCLEWRVYKLGYPCFLLVQTFKS